MIGFVIIAYGNLACGFMETLEHILGKQPYCQTVSIQASTSLDYGKHRLFQALESVDNGEGTIILTDIFGGTASNIALSFLEAGRIEIVAGMNMPMLIKLAEIRQKPQITLQDVLYQTEEAGRQYIGVPAMFL